MQFTDLTKANPTNLKKAYEYDLEKVEADKGVKITKHVHSQIAKKCNKTSAVGAITYDEIDLKVLEDKQCYTTAAFLMNCFQERGIRPDTPFHNNDEERYPVDLSWTRYVEYNVIGGGMRLIYDSTTPALFLSCHYSYPARVTCSGGGAFSATFATMLGELRLTYLRLKGHSDGSYSAFMQEDPNKFDKRAKALALQARRSPQFIEWLKNKSARQDKSIVKTLYNLDI